MTASPLGELVTLTEHLAASPVEGGLGLVPLEVRPGYVRAQVPVGPVDGDGRVNALVLAVAADCGLGIGVHSSVPGSAVTVLSR